MGKATKANIAEQLRSLATPVTDLHTMPGNPRKGDVEAVKRSYERFGQRKPIVALLDGTVIAGNHQLLAARALGWSEIAVVRVDDDEMTAKAFALADNRTSDLGTYDDDLLQQMIEEVSIDETLLIASGFGTDDLLAAIEDASVGGDEDDDEPYTPVVKIPQYDVTGEMPDIADLVETDNAERLIAAINASTVPEDVKTFLRCSAHRHMRFNYRAIAEFYAHADEETQRLFEQSALVIIDFEDAIANGFAVFSAAVAEIRARDDDT